MKKDAEYLVFEFWTKTFLGIFKDTLEFTPIDSTFRCQVFCIREKLDHLQIIATSRHISCGGYDLENVRWQDHELSGSSKLTPGDPYYLYIYEPEGYRLAMVTGTGTELLGNKKSGSIRVISLKSVAPSSPNGILPITRIKTTDLPGSELPLADLRYTTL